MEFDELSVFERFAIRPDGSINASIADQTRRVFEIASDRFVRESPINTPIFGFVDRATSSSIFTQIELPVIIEMNRNFTRVRAQQ